MNKNIIVFVLIVLVLMTAVQAFQLGSLKTKVSNLKVTGSSSSANGGSTPQSSGGGVVPTNIQQLPGMVGGC